MVAVIHGPDLGQRHMALVDEHEEILGKVVQKRQGRGAHRPAGDDSGIVLNTGAVAQLPHHLHVVFRPLLDALGFHRFLLLLEEPHLLPHLFLDLFHRPVHLLLGGDVVAGGVDGHMIQNPGGRAGEGLDLGDALHLVPPELNADGVVFGVDRVDVDGIAPDPEGVALKGNVVALVADLDQLADQLLPALFHAGAERDDHVLVVDGVAQTVNAGDRGHYNDVSPLKEGGSCAVAEPLDLLVDGGVLLNKGIRVRDIGLRLVVVVIGDKILHGVIREKLLKLAAQLGSQRLVMGQHQRGTLDLLDDLRHGKGLTGAGDA